MKQVYQYANYWIVQIANEIRIFYALCVFVSICSAMYSHKCNIWPMWPDSTDRQWLQAIYYSRCVIWVSYNIMDVLHAKRDDPMSGHNGRNADDSNNSTTWYRLAKHKCSSAECLTHSGRDKLAVISQTTVSYAFSWKKCVNFAKDFTEVCS